MPDDLPFAEDLLGPAPVAAPAEASQGLPYAEDLLGAAKAPAPLSGPLMDFSFGHPSNAVANIADAFGQGAKEGWGAGDLGLEKESSDWLRKAGVFNDYSEGHGTLIKAFNEAFIRPAIAGVDLVGRGAMAVGTGIGGAIGQTAEELGLSKLTGNAPGEAMRTGGAAVQELMMRAAGEHAEASPTAAIRENLRQQPSLNAQLAKDYPLFRDVIDPARAMNVIGPGGESAWKGLTDAPSVDPAVAAETATKTAEEVAPAAAEDALQGNAPAPQAQPPQDVHTVARSLDPATFQQYDEIQQRQGVYRGWLDELTDQNRQTVEANPPNAAALKTVGDQIDTILGKVNGVEDRLTDKAAARLDALREQQDDLAEADRQAALADTPDMSRLRRQLQALDYRARDLAPDVSDAYRRAQEHLGIPEDADLPGANAEAPGEATPIAEPLTEKQDEQPAAQPETPAEEVLAAEAQPKAAAIEPTPAMKVDIAGDVAQKLQAAGRPADEANAAADLVQAHYEARATRFGGAKGTAEELYSAEAPQIKGGEAGGRAGAAAGKAAIRDGRTTITLFKKADASTFIHETGHHWLEELLGDAKDETAPAGLKTDAATVRDWLGAVGDEAITTRQHEKFARGFERYVMEGVAPSKRLAGVFGQFKAWLTGIYQRVEALRSPITDDIRDVFARLLSTGENENPTIAAEAERGRAAPAERAKTFADLHEQDAAADYATQEEAVAAADRIGTETEKLRSDPEIRNEVEGKSNERPDSNGDDGGDGSAGGTAGGGEKSGRQPGGDRELAPVDAGGNRAEAEGADAARAGRPAESVTADAASSNADAPAVRQAQEVVKAANIRLDKINGTAAMNAALQEIAKANGDFMDARYGERAYQMAREIENTRTLLRAVTADYQTARDRFAETGTPAAAEEYVRKSQRAAMVFDRLSTLSSDWGHAGHALNRVMDPLDKSKEIGGSLKDLTGKTLFQLRQEAQLSSKLESAEQIGKFASDMAKTPWQKFREGLISYFVNNLISGPITHAAYGIGNTTFALYKAVPETIVQATAGAVRAALGGGEAADRVYYGEVGAQLYGIVRGAREGIVPAMRALRSGVSVLPGVSEAEALAAKREPAIPGKIGYVLETPSRVVSGIHTLFYTMAYSQEIARLAYREAAERGLRGDAFNKAVAEMTQAPSDAMVEAAGNEAIQQVLMKRPAYGGAQYHLQALVNGNLAAKIIMPFMQIGANILSEGLIERTGLSIVKSDVRDDLMGVNGGAARDIRAGKIIAGSMLGVGVVGLAAEGLITGGGPSEPTKRRVMEDAGWKPYSIKVGDTYIPFRKYLGPLGPLVAATTDIYEVGHSMSSEGLTKATAAATFGLAEVVADETWMTGLSSFVDAARHWDTAGDRYVRNLATSFLPFSVGLSQTARLVDPYAREARTLVDSVRAKIPFVSEGLLPRYSIWGQPLMNSTMVSPSTLRSDPVDQRLMALDMGVTMPERKIRGQELTGAQYAEYSQLAGQQSKQALDMLVGQSWFSASPVEVQKDIIRKVISKSRAQAEATIMSRYLGKGSLDIVARATAAKIAKTQ
jgi:hypothetical protein